MPLKGQQWLAREIQRWMSDVEQFAIRSQHSHVIRHFINAHNEFQFVSHNRELLNLNQLERATST